MPPKISPQHLDLHFSEKKKRFFAILGIAIRVAARKGPKRRFSQESGAEMVGLFVLVLLPCFAQETRMFELCFCYQSCIRAAHLEGESGAGMVASLCSCSYRDLHKKRVCSSFVFVIKAA